MLKTLHRISLEEVLETSLIKTLCDKDSSDFEVQDDHNL